MKSDRFRLYRIAMAAILFASPVLVLFGSESLSNAVSPNGRSAADPSGFAAKVTLTDGTTRAVRVEGVGCSVSICSRVAIEGKAENNALLETPLHSIVSVRHLPGEDWVTLVLKDGSQRRISLVTDFRVLYLTGESKGPLKLDFSKILSLEFLAQTGAATSKVTTAR